MRPLREPRSDVSAGLFRRWATGIVSSARRASRHVVVHAAGVNFAMIGITTFAGVLIARWLGAEGRGYYAAIMAWFALAQVIGELGQSGAVTFWVSRDPSRAKDYVASSRLLMLVIGVLVAAVGIVLSPLFAHGIESVTVAYRIAFGGCLLNSLCAASVYALQGTSINRWNIVRISQPIAYLVLIVALALSHKLDIIWVSVALVASILVQFSIAIGQGIVEGLEGGRPRKALVKELAIYGVAYSGSAIPGSLASQYDRLVLSGVAIPAQLGLYAVAGSVAGLAYPFSTAVASVVFPRSARADLDEAGRRHLERRAIFGTALVSLGISMAIAIGVAPLIPLVFGQSFQAAIELVWWIIPAIFFRSVSQVISALLRGRGRPGLVTYGQLFGLVAGVATIFPFMAWLGVRGAALAVSLGELVVLAVTIAMFVAERRRTLRTFKKDESVGASDVGADVHESRETEESSY